MITKLLSIVGRINSDKKVKYSYADTPFLRAINERYKKVNKKIKDKLKKII